MSRTFRFETAGRTINEIAHPDICKCASYRLDRPLTVTVNNVLELCDGQFFLIEYQGEERIRTLLEGRWVLPTIKTVPEKKASKAKTVLVKVPAKE